MSLYLVKPKKKTKENMKGRSSRQVETNNPRESLNTSSIQKYLKEAGVKSPGMEGKHLGTKKKDQQKQKGGQGDRPHEEPDSEGTSAYTVAEEQRIMAQVPSKTDMSEMFTKLERKLESIIKEEILNVRSDMGHLLRRVEEAEEASSKQAKDLADLKEQVKKVQSENRALAFRLEEQENQSRRQNLRIRSIPEQQNEDLGEKMRKIFNPLLGRREDEVLRIDRVHRIRKPPHIKQDIPRDVIIKFHQYEDKEKIWKKLKGAPPLKFENKDLQIFTDLSAGTLERRRQMRPVLDLLRKANLKYSWGFPTSLIVIKEGRSFRMRYMEEMQDFCSNLGIPVPVLE